MTGIVPTKGIYLQIAEVLMERIEKGEYKPGQQLPTETELGREFNVSRVTANSAVQILRYVGVARVERGRGAFVTKPGRACPHCGQALKD